MMWKKYQKILQYFQVQNRESLEPLKRIDYTEMRPKMFPQLSVMIDPKGDVYGYHEATFLDKEGSDDISNLDNFKLYFKGIVLETFDFSEPFLFFWKYITL